MFHSYYAHSTKTTDKSDWQPLSEHLRNVGELAEQFAAAFNAGQWGRCVGLLHDIGKACAAFLARLEGKATRVDHVTFGAQLALKCENKLGYLLAYVICGHHGGLPDGGPQEGQLHYRLRKNTEKTELLPEVDCTWKLTFPFQLQRECAMFSMAFFTRMLFSCLVDADFLDTEAFCDPDKSTRRTALHRNDFVSLRSLLQSFISKKQAQAQPGKVNAARQKILAQCLAKAAEPQGFYSLVVPTGGGKTLSSLTFALEHAVQHNLARVIYAIPFTSIIEQNAEVFRQAIGENNVLEHHCNYRDQDSREDSVYDKWRGLAAENWDAPVVVTTNVQFFESLYSNKTSRCRKLHNIAGSVIVLDEAQAIPTEYLKPCLSALRELVDHYRCTVVLCTATPPAFDDASLLRSALPRIEKIFDDPDQLYAELKRVRVEFIGKLSNTELAQRLDNHEQVLCIVSTKKQAQQVFADLTDQEGAFHLSTNMYPEHRLRALQAIRQRLAAKLPCRVVATSLVEAGVDLDFPVVYRAMAGLDSLAQAAGRCNREGHADHGLVYVFEPEDMPAMPWLRRRISRAKETLRSFPGNDCLGLAPMRRYFELLYDVESLDEKNIVARLNPKPHAELIFPFQEVAQDFRLIEEEGIGVIMPGLPEDREAIHALVEQLRHDPFPHAARRKLQHFSVVVRSKVLDRLRSQGAVEIIRETWPILLNSAAYDGSMGFRADMAELWDPEQLFF